MIRTNEYIVVKSRKTPKGLGEWAPVKEYRRIETYSLKDAREFLVDLENGEIPGHSQNCLYEIREICYCDRKE